MNIGVLGSGIVGQVLSKAFREEGHNVMLGTRNIQKEEVVKFRNDNPGIAVGDFAAAASHGELLVLAVKGEVATSVVDLAGVENLSNKIIIDTTNPIASSPPENGVLKYFTVQNTSLLETLQQKAPAARFVKAFNSVGNAAMYKPNYSAGKPTMFICGNDDAAKKEVTSILTDFGWDTEDMGKAAAARAIEPLCMLWCIPGLLHNQWTHAFKLLRD